MKKLLTAQVKAIGEHYILSRLTALGFIVGLPPENTKHVDLLVMSDDGSASFQIQVKTRRAERSRDWTMKNIHERIISDKLFYIFVTLPKQWTDKNQPETFIVPSKIVADVLKQSHKDWKATPGRNGRKRNDTDMRRIKFSYPDSPSIPTKWLEEYRDNWSILK